MHPKIRSILEQSRIPYKVHEHALLKREIRSPQDFASELGYEMSRIAKSLFVRASSRDRYAVVACSMGRKIDFSVLAKHFSISKMEVASPDELKQHLGYPPNGVSPIGAEPIPVIMDSG